MPGNGPLLGAAFLGATAGDITRFGSRDRPAGLAGLAPVPRGSGSVSGKADDPLVGPVPVAAARFKVRRPKVAVSPAEGLTAGQPPCLRGLDLVVSVPADLHPAAVDLRYLLDDVVYVALPPDHMPVGRVQVGLADLAEEVRVVGADLGRRGVRPPPGCARVPAAPA